MMLTQRLPGILAHWRDAMSKFCSTAPKHSNLIFLAVRDMKVIRPTHIYTGTKEQAGDLSSKL